MSLLFLFASIGVLNGFLVSIYLLIKKGRSVSEFYFGGLLFVLSVRIGKSILYYFDRETDLLVLQIGLSFCVLIGPLFFFFVKHKFQSSSSFRRLDLSLITFLSAVILMVGWILPYRSFPEVWNGVIIYFIYGVWLLFSFLAYATVFSNWDYLNKVAAKADRFYLLSIVVAYGFITLTYQLALFTGIFYIWGSLIFTVSFYVLLGRLIAKRFEVLPKLDILPIENAHHLMANVREVMEKEQLYLNVKLRLEDVANATGLSRHMLSRLLNETYPHGFAQFVKEYRVAEAKDLIKNHPEWSLEGVGFEAGFSSRSSFFEAFKKVESVTPAVFRKQLKVETSPE